MNEYTARNGVKVEWDGDTLKVDTLAYFDRWGTHYPALTEFFRAEEDERLGRWRWPENPDFVMYPDDDGDVMVLDEREPSAHFYPRVSSVASITTDRARAAQAYFDTHPEPKPWHDAKPGEIWVLDVEDSETTGHRAPYEVLLLGDFREVATGLIYGPRHRQIRAGRRIYPEDDDS
ncbi:hypothetical protein [Microbacterium sp. ProA8]|uniref:hypothetical protein n=1 Tax=Microbacterium chionoecetis TaxID=3153754 RepID=UPI00326441EC